MMMGDGGLLSGGFRRTSHGRARPLGRPAGAPRPARLGKDDVMEDPEPARSGDLFGERAAARRFRRGAEGVADALRESAPETATALGDHRFDDRLSDLSAEGIAARGDLLRDALQALDGVDDEGLTAGDRVDREILRTAVAADLWRLEELREHEHDPLVHLPGDALHPLLAREVGEPAARALAVASRLGGGSHPPRRPPRPPPPVPPGPPATAVR